MNKRSAMFVAAGLVAALLAGGTALSFSLAGGTAAAQDARVQPVVKTKHRTITIHKKAKAEAARVVTISRPSTTTTATSSSTASSADDDAFEDEVGSEDQESGSEDQSDGFEQDSADDSSGSDSGSGGDD